MKRALLIVALCATWTQANAGAAFPVTLPAASTAPTVDDGRGTDYVVSKADNICGLDNPKQLTRPAKVNYSSLLEATPEMKTLKRERIKTSSPRGINLRTQAENRIRKACEKVRSEKSFCSVWKQITRRDSKAVSDVTKSVINKL